MTTSPTAVNPFRYPLRGSATTLKTAVWQAGPDGKDHSAGKTDFALSHDYLWVQYDFSVPLVWITAVENVGPGFRVVWKNPIEGTQEFATFCVRTMFSYNLKRRDELVRRVREAAALARSRPQPEAAAAAAALPRCQVCGLTGPQQYDFTWMFCAVHFIVTKPDRRLLCPSHARRRARLLLASNLITANLGFGLFVSPLYAWANALEARNKGAINKFEAAFWMVLATFPYALIAWMLAWVVWYVIHF